jgi:hypothetical protein
MKLAKLLCGLALLGLLSAAPAFAQKKLVPSEAKDHIGQTATVCGNVASTHFASSSNKQPTFLNLDKPYPNAIFTIVIWGNDRSKFGNPETKYANKLVCVTGLIKDYRGAPEIIAEEPGQIEIQK